MIREQLVKKLTARNYVTIITTTALIFCVIYGLTNTTAAVKALENPLVTYIFGQFGTVVVMIYVFYYRKNRSKTEPDT